MEHFLPRQRVPFLVLFSLSFAALFQRISPLYAPSISAPLYLFGPLRPSTQTVRVRFELECFLPSLTAGDLFVSPFRLFGGIVRGASHAFSISRGLSLPCRRANGPWLFPLCSNYQLECSFGSPRGTRLCVPSRPPLPPHSRNGQLALQTIIDCVHADGNEKACSPPSVVLARGGQNGEEERRTR